MTEPSIVEVANIETNHESCQCAKAPRSVSFHIPIVPDCRLRRTAAKFSYRKTKLSSVMETLKNAGDAGGGTKSYCGLRPIEPKGYFFE